MNRSGSSGLSQLYRPDRSSSQEGDLSAVCRRGDRDGASQALGITRINSDLSACRMSAARRASTNCFCERHSNRVPRNPKTIRRLGARSFWPLRADPGNPGNPTFTGLNGRTLEAAKLFESANGENSRSFASLRMTIRSSTLYPQPSTRSLRSANRRRSFSGSASGETRRNSPREAPVLPARRSYSCSGRSTMSPVS